MSYKNDHLSALEKSQKVFSGIVNNLMYIIHLFIADQARYLICSKYWDRLAWLNSVDTDQMPQQHLIRVGSVYYSSSIFSGESTDIIMAFNF